MFKQFQNIDSAFRHIRLFSIAFLLVNGAICIYTLYQTSQVLKAGQNKIYVIANGKLMDALATARLSEFVAALPLGLETGVGDNGVLFSGGQRQRLSLARAILRGVKLLLLDEATSALDDENEGQVLENLGAAGIAVVLATHRVHKHFSAERVFRLQHGQLIEETKAAWVSSPDKPSLAYIGTNE